MKSDLEKYLEQIKEKQEEVKQKFDEMSDCYNNCRKFCDEMKSNGYRMTAEEKNKEGLLLKRYKASMNEFQKASEELSNLTKI